jgi:Flp pilus assembly protein TadD
MRSYAPGAKVSDLALTDVQVPIGTPAETGNPQSPDPAPDPAEHRTHSAVVRAELLRLVETSPDGGAADEARYLDEATREFESGEIDKPLWAKALDLSGGDAALAKSGYLRARATALRVARRNTRTSSRRSRGSKQKKKRWALPSLGGWWRSRRTMLFAGAFGSALVVAGLLFVHPEDTSSPLSAPARVAPVVRSAPAASTAVAKPAADKGSPERMAVTNEDFAAKVEALKAEGNWNVLVLYAVEWTRKVPSSADAWYELSAGYAKLRQFNEAQEAAMNAVRLAPARFEAWQRLGEVNVTLRQPAEAIAAYEKAVALNERDVTSLVQMGMLHAQLGQLAPAKIAFARALEVSPNDAEALCGSAAVAQKDGRQKDADAIARQMKAADVRCTEAVAVAVAPAPAAHPSAASGKPPARTAR